MQLFIGILLVISFLTEDGSAEVIVDTAAVKAAKVNLFKQWFSTNGGIVNGLNVEEFEVGFFSSLTLSFSLHELIYHLVLFMHA